MDLLRHRGPRGLMGVCLGVKEKVGRMTIEVRKAEFTDQF